MKQKTTAYKKNTETDKSTIDETNTLPILRVNILRQRLINLLKLEQMDIDNRLRTIVDQLEEYTSSFTQDQKIQFQLSGALIPDRVQLNNSTVYFGNANRSFEVTTTICGYPGFCAKDTYNQCLNSTLINCSQCGVTRASIFMFFTLVIGLMILCGNLMVILVSIRRYRRRGLDKMDACKTSLSIADFIIGNLV